MMRLFLLILKLALAIGLIVWLANQPGTAQIVWHDTVIETSAAFLTLAVVLAVFCLVTLYRGWRFVMDVPRFWGFRNKIARLQRGQSMLTQGLVAIAAGNAAEAGRLAIKARKQLGDTAATRLLQAQAAQLAGDHDMAREIFQKLAADSDSAVLGYRGLIMAALRERRWDEAEKYMGLLRRVKPDTPWLCLIQFELATRRQHWREASAALAQASALHLVDARRAKSDQAAALLAAAAVEARQGRKQEALQTLEQAARFAPHWAPVALALAAQQLATDHRRAALRTIEKAWAASPHPQLADYYRVAAGEGKPLEAYKQIERLTRATATHPDSKLALAEAALAADLWGEARRYFTALIAGNAATQSVYRALAKLERRESGDEQAAAQWLAKAADATPDPRWLCTGCGGSHDEWLSLCAHCGAFNLLAWQVPGVSRASDKNAPIAGLLGTGL